MNIHCIENFFAVHDFWETCACPENRVSPEIFHCIEYIFYHSGFFNNLRLPWKTELPRNFHCIEYTFYIQEFWATCACPEQQRVPWIHSTEYIFFIIQDFWATCACPEKQSYPGIFHCMEYTFYIQNFWGTCACLEKQNLPWILYIFYCSGFLSNVRLPWKTELPWNFSLYWICIFYHSGFLSNLRLAWKQSLPWNFSSPGGGHHPPDPLPRTPLSLSEKWDCNQNQRWVKFEPSCAHPTVLTVWLYQEVCWKQKIAVVTVHVLYIHGHCTYMVVTVHEGVNYLQEFAWRASRSSRYLESRSPTEFNFQFRLLLKSEL